MIGFFKKITFKDKVKRVLAEKQRELVRAEMFAIAIPSLRKEIEYLCRWLETATEPAATNVDAFDSAPPL